jgi:hypothetical protein
LREKELPDHLQTVVQRIVRYLVAHPDAKDTAEGITRWWVGEDLARKSVQEALDLLVSEGLLMKREAPSVEAIYGLKKKAGEARGGESASG